MSLLTRLSGALVLLAALSAAQAADRLFEQPLDAAQALALLGPAAAELQDAQTLRGRFSQSRQRAQLPRPLLSEGDFLFVRGRGIAWNTQQPFASQLVFTATQLIRREGRRERRLDTASQPALRELGETLFAVFSLDLAALAPRFAIYGVRDAGSPWRLGLRPREPAGKLREIEVSGHDSVERVLLREEGGDLTDIQLHEVRAAATPPDAADLAPFPGNP